MRDPGEHSLRWRHRRGWVSAGAILLALLVGACGGGGQVALTTPTPTPAPTPPPPTDFMYVADIAANTVMGFTVGDDGSLTPVPGSPFPTGGIQALSIVADSSKKFLYVVDGLAKSVTGFTIDAHTGSLSRVPGPAIDTGLEPRHIVAHPTLPRLYVAENATMMDGDLTVMSFDSATGSITSSEAVPSAAFPQFVDIHPSGRFLYVGSASPGVALHPLRSDGSPESVRELRPPALVAARVLKMSASGDRLFVYEDAFSRLFAYSVDGNTGAITEGSGPRPHVGFVMDLSVHPSGKYLYLHTLTATVPSYAIDDQLRLTPLPGSPTQLTPGTEESIVNLEPKGRFAYIFEGPQAARIVRTCRIDEGALTTLRTDSIGTYPFATAFVYR
jgi:6-phosphogluconolactonase